MVMTDDNSWQPVNKVMKKEYSGDLYAIKGTGLYDQIVCTPNHKFLTQNGWKRADRLLAGNPDGRINNPDKFKILDFQFVKKYKPIDITEHFNTTMDKQLSYTDEKHVRTKTREVNHGTELWKEHGSVVNRYIEPQEDFMYFIGRWLGDGSITKRRAKKVVNSSILQIVFN